MKHLVCLAALLLVSCGKEEPKPEPKVKAVETSKPAPEKKMPPVPQGKLPKMDPEKAKFIAVPSTPKDPEAKKVEKPATEVPKSGPPATEIKKAAPPAVETKPAEPAVPEVKKAEPAAAAKP